MPRAEVVSAALGIVLAPGETVVLQARAVEHLTLSEGIVLIACRDRAGRLLRDRDDGTLPVRVKRMGRACGEEACFCFLLQGQDPLISRPAA